MIIDGLFGSNTMLMEKSMSLRTARHNLLASNIANAETPNYRAVDIDFKATMDNYLQKEQQESSTPKLELQTTDERHLTLNGVRNGSPGSDKIVFAAGDDISIGNDNNSVNAEEQLARMQANTMLFSATAQMYAKKMSGLNSAIDTLGKV
jgi:flagellar basal-body rod protein FlgB